MARVVDRRDAFTTLVSARDNILTGDKRDQPDPVTSTFPQFDKDQLIEEHKSQLPQVKGIDLSVI